MMFRSVTIIGVGLLGGSLALAMKEKALCGSITGCGRSEQNLRDARDRGMIDSYEQDPAEACADADLVVLATPVGTFVELAAEISDSLKQGALVIDVGSVKGPLVYEMEGLMPDGANFVGCHPIAGSEQSGIDAARADLFKGALCIITRTGSTDDGAFNAAASLWRAVGSKVDILSPERHDVVYGLVSHLPHLAAYALVNAVSELDAECLRYAGNGFRDATRIAASSPAVWRDICELNGENLAKFLDYLKEGIEKMSEQLKKGDLEGLEISIAKASELRKSIEG